MARPKRIARADVLRAALAIVDDEGLEGLTMRRLGRALGVEAMSLYRHVANKEAVLDGVHEAVLADVRWPQTTGVWQRDVVSGALALRDALRRHPNVLPLFATRPATTDASLAHLERALAQLEAPLPDLTTRVMAVQSVLALVLGHALFHDTPAGLGPDYERLDPETFPVLSTVGQALEGYDPDAELAFALASLVRGFEGPR